MATQRALWNEYRVTWDAFSRNLDRLQSCVESGDRANIEEALIAVEQSKSAHNAARDRLAEQLAGSPRTASRDRFHNEEEHIRQKAQMVWELSGKPQNSAEADWLLAERLVRSAAAV
jgi:hypothetical protein